MRSLSYIILLMSLIGHCQSESLSCIQVRLQNCSVGEDTVLRQIEKEQLFDRFHHYLSQPNSQFVLVALDTNSRRDFGYENYVEKGFEDICSLENLQKKTSIIRNKDQLDLRIVV